MDIYDSGAAHFALFAFDVWSCVAKMPKSINKNFMNEFHRRIWKVKVFENGGNVHTLYFFNT